MIHSKQPYLFLYKLLSSVKLLKCPELLNGSRVNSGVGDVRRNLYLVSSVAVYHT